MVSSGADGSRNHEILGTAREPEEAAGLIALFNQAEQDHEIA
jgi:hypothetical protein